MSLAAFAAEVPPPAPQGRRSIPFDYSFTFQLLGQPGRVAGADLTVSVEAAFTAVSVGYGVIPLVEEVRFGPSLARDLVPALAAVPAPAGLPPALANLLAARAGLGAAQAALLGGLARGPDTPLAALTPAEQTVLVVPPRQVTVGDLIQALARALDEAAPAAAGELGPRTEAALRSGIRLNPDVARAFLLARPDAALATGQLERLFEASSAPPDRVQFLYALSEPGSGREFQSQPLLNVAGLGAADGGRPFRYFAEPITFAPRTTIRLEVTELSQVRGELHVVLHGRKVLGGAGTPTGRAARRQRRRRP